MGRERRITNQLRVSVYIALACFSLFLVQGRIASGQVDEGSISGVVQDSTGAVVPNATVTLLNTDQGITRETKTNATGVYTFSPVRIGHYTITVTSTGFSKTTHSNLTVQVAQALDVNIVLKPGSSF